MRTDARHMQGKTTLSEKVQRGFGYCPQQNALFDKLTAREMLRVYLGRYRNYANLSATTQNDPFLA